MKSERITLYVGPAGAEKAAKAGAMLSTKKEGRKELQTLLLPLLSGPVEFVKHARSFTWQGRRGGAKEVAIVDWLHKHGVGVTYDIV